MKDPNPISETTLNSFLNIALLYGPSGKIRQKEGISQWEKNGLTTFSLVTYIFLSKTNTILAY